MLSLSSYLLYSALAGTRELTSPSHPCGETDTSAADLLPVDDPDRPPNLYHSIAYSLRAGGMTIERLFTRVAEAEAAMSPPELICEPLAALLCYAPSESGTDTLRHL